jgi:hypothetical protein
MYCLQTVTLLAACILLVAFLAYFSTLKMDAIFSSEMSVNFYYTTGRHIPEDSILHSHRPELSDRS